MARLLRMVAAGCAAALALTWLTLTGGTVHAQRDPFWVAQVAWPAVNVHAQPNAQSDVRRVAREGDLLRVAGATDGIEGDGGAWLATTEGYVPEGSLQEAHGEWVDSWQLPDPSEAQHGFWVEVSSEGKVRAGPTTNAPVLGTLTPGMRVKVLAEERDPDGDPVPWYRIDGGRYAGGRLYSAHTSRLPDPQPNATPPAEGAAGTWLVVDRSAGTLTLVKDGQPAYTTYVSLGRAGVETPAGQYQIVSKLPFDDMSSARNPAADRPYAMPNVPSVQYFSEDGNAVHGTYWHDQFGTRESQGCVNLSMTDGAYVFTQTQESTPFVIVD